MNLNILPQLIENSILIWVGAIGLFIIFLMLFSKSSNKMVNVYLVVIFILGSIRNVMLGITDELDINHLINPKFISPIFLSVVPCLFLYFKSLVKDNITFYGKNFVHFIFPTLLLFLNLIQEYFNILSGTFIGDFKFSLIVGFFIIYMLLSYHLLNKNLWNRNNKEFIEPRHYELIKGWTYFIFIISSLMYLRIIYSICFEKILNEPLQGYRFLLVAVLPWLLVYGKILITPEILYGHPRLMKRPNTNSENFQINDSAWIFDQVEITNSYSETWEDRVKNTILPYIIDIEKFINKNHPFRDKKFSFKELAAQMDIPVSHLHFILKYFSVMTFEEYKESSMVNDAKQLIENGEFDASNLENLFLKVGFTNSINFTNTFNKFTGYSPEDYLKR